MKIMKKYIALLLFAAFCSVPVCAQTKTPLMGWSSWNTYGVGISDSLIRCQADAMVRTGLKDAGFRYINIDDGYFGGRDKSGNLQLNMKRFRGSMRALTDYIHGLGLKAGIYTDAGANTCASYGDGDSGGIGSAIYGHEEQDARLFFGDWNFDFIKIDYCGAGDLNLDESQRYTYIVNTFRRLGYGNVSINICRWAFPGVWAKGVSDSWRISGDIRADWNSVKYIIDKNLYLSAFASDGHFNDMDMLEVGRGMTPEEDETHFGMWCIMSSPLLVGCDMTRISDNALQLMTNPELIAINQDSLALQAYVVQHSGDTYVLAKDLLQRHGTVRAVALYNASDSVAHFFVPLSTLELAGRTRVRDFIHHKDLPSVKNILMLDVPGHATKILRLQAQRRLEPTLYEAEWAYLNKYDDLAQHAKGIQCAPQTGASGGMKVVNIGGSRDNFMEWNNVFSEQGGDYQLTISYLPRPLSTIQMSINGADAVTIKPLSDGTGIKQAVIPVHLNKGNNDVKIFSAITWTPDIDCIQLKKIVLNEKLASRRVDKQTSM